MFSSSTAGIIGMTIVVIAYVFSPYTLYKASNGGLGRGADGHAKVPSIAGSWMLVIVIAISLPFAERKIGDMSNNITGINSYLID